MTLQYNYYDDWKTAELKCPECGWTGSFEEGSVEYYKELMDCSCPVCKDFPNHILAIVSYPTMAESEANWDKVSDVDKQMITLRKELHTARESLILKTPDELPDLDGTELILVWDWEGEEPGSTVIKYGDREIWREPAFFEGYMRYKEVVDILKNKYGARLLDVIPTEASLLYLYGDDFGSVEIVDSVRASLRENKNNKNGGNHVY